jgi:predicted porin
MNKKLIALAIAGLSAAPAAMAQTANPVTLYGRAYVMFESVEAKGGATPVARRNRVSDQASYVGVRGTEDIGGGLKAFFQLEWGYRPDDNVTTAAVGVPSPTPGNINNTPFSGRNSAVGLQGGFGSILLGRWDTPMKVSQTAVDPWGDLTMGDITGAALDQGNFSRRETNAVQYWSPNIAGFSARLHYTANEGKGNLTVTGTTPAIVLSANPSVSGASVSYSGGNLYVALAYEKHKDAFALVTGTGATATARTGSEEGTAVAASYKFGPAKVSGQYGEYKRDGNVKDKSYFAGLEWAFGKNVLIATFQHAELDNSSAECDMGAIGYRYDFSRRTFFIASYTKVENESGMNCNFGTGPIGAAGQNPQGVGLGVRHLF